MGRSLAGDFCVGVGFRGGSPGLGFQGLYLQTLSLNKSGEHGRLSAVRKKPQTKNKQGVRVEAPTRVPGFVPTLQDAKPSAGWKPRTRVPGFVPACPPWRANPESGGSPGQGGRVEAPDFSPGSTAAFRPCERSPKTKTGFSPRPRLLSAEPFAARAAAVPRHVVIPTERLPRRGICFESCIRLWRRHLLCF
jgi:hypothetical protein